MIATAAAAAMPPHRIVLGRRRCRVDCGRLAGSRRPAGGGRLRRDGSHDLILEGRVRFLPQRRVAEEAPQGVEVVADVVVERDVVVAGQVGDAIVFGSHGVTSFHLPVRRQGRIGFHVRFILPRSGDGRAGRRAGGGPGATGT